MTSPIKRAYEAKTEVKDGERAVYATINTDAIDRYRTVIVPKGGRFTNYLNNRVVLVNHGEVNAGLPVGRCEYIKAYRDRIVAKTVFMSRELSEFADQVFRMYQEKYLNAFSISFDPDAGQYGAPTPDEIRKRPELAECRCVYRSWDLLEYSCVTVPGNTEALAEAVSRGYQLPDWFDRSGLPDPKTQATPPPAAPALPPLVGRTLDEVQRALSRQVHGQARTLSEQALRDAQDLARGRV